MFPSHVGRVCAPESEGVLVRRADVDVDRCAHHEEAHPAGDPARLAQSPQGNGQGDGVSRRPLSGGVWVYAHTCIHAYAPTLLHSYTPTTLMRSLYLEAYVIPRTDEALFEAAANGHEVQSINRHYILFY
jgi:hypothetical protein